MRFTMTSESISAAKYLTARFAVIHPIGFDSFGFRRPHFSLLRWYRMYSMMFLQRLLPRKAFPAHSAYKRPMHCLVAVDVFCVFPQRRGIHKRQCAESAFFGSFPAMDPLVDFQIFLQRMAFTAESAHERLQVIIPLVLSVELQFVEHSVAAIQRTVISFVRSCGLHILSATVMASAPFMRIQSVCRRERTAAFMANVE